MVLPIDNPTKSFWIEGAESPYRNHRSTPELPSEVDVVIVGSGYTGATMAYWIHKVSNYDPIFRKHTDNVRSSLKTGKPQTCLFLRLETFVEVLLVEMVRFSIRPLKHILILTKCCRRTTKTSLLLSLSSLVCPLRPRWSPQGHPTRSRPPDSV